MFFGCGGVLLKISVLEYVCDMRLVWFLDVIVMKYFIFDVKIWFVIVVMVKFDWLMLMSGWICVLYLFVFMVYL